jgi:ribosomal protein S18 acetylase RimI-like enzyme
MAGCWRAHPVITICNAEPKDAESILALQKFAYQSEAELYNDWTLPPLTQTLESLLEEFASSVVLKAVSGERIVGSVRAKVATGICAIGRLVVHPDYQGQGIGSRLLRSIESRFPDVTKYELFTGSKSEANIRLYQRHGYNISRTQALSPTVSLTFLEKPGDAGY